MIPKVMTLDAGFAFGRGRKKAKEHTGLPRQAARARAGASGLLACPVIFSPSPPPFQEPRDRLSVGSVHPGKWRQSWLLDQHHEVERDLNALMASGFRSSNTRHVSWG